MSKSILISIRPKWCELIASGKKTIEVRKTKPKIKCPFKCYMYMTKDAKIHYYTDEYGDIQKELIPQTIVGEFVCDRVITARQFMDGGYNPEWSDDEDCITEQEFNDYSSNAHTLYGWHISDLVIYDYPKDVTDFIRCVVPPLYEDCKDCSVMDIKTCKGCGYYAHLTRPPQSWCYVEEL